MRNPGSMFVRKSRSLDSRRDRAKRWGGENHSRRSLGMTKHKQDAPKARWEALGELGGAAITQALFKSVSGRPYQPQANQD